MFDMRPSLHNIPWIAIVLGFCALVSAWVIADQSRGGVPVMYDSMSATDVAESSPVMPPSAMGVDEGYAARDSVAPTPAMIPSDMQGVMYGGKGGGGVAPMYYPYPGGTATAGDSREFLKMYYNASMFTRDVPGLTRRIETTVRGHAGRIDHISSSKEYGSVSFIVPQSKFEAFRDEIEKMVDWRFLSVSVNSENLLPQKQGIEQQQKYTEQNITDLTAARKKLVADHTSAVASLQSQIDANDREITSLTGRTDPASLTRLDILAKEQSTLRNRLASENSSYTYQRDSIDLEIKYTNENLGNIKEQDQNLIDNVAMVNGTISLQWISLWDMAHTYLPGYWIPAIFAALAAIAYWRHRRRHHTQSI